VKNSHIKVLDYHNDFSSELSPRNQSPRGLWYSESHLNWALNKQATRHAIHIYQTNVSGGNQTITSDTTWPADDYAPTKAGTTVNVPGGITYNVPAPVIGQEHCEVSGKFPTFGFSLTNIYSRSAQTTMQLFTGGKALPKRDNLFVVRGSATRILTETAQPPYPPGTETEPIQDKTKITMGELGQLDATGVVWAVLPNGVTKDVTPKVSGVDFYAFGADHTKCVLTNICERGAPRPADRTDLGVGEYVSVYFTPSPAGIQIDWTTTAGSVTPASGSGTRFTAPSNAMSATVTASVKGLKCPVTFNVEKPTGVSAVITSTTANAIPSGIAGAWMHMDVTVQPTNVSFYRIEMIEIGQAATSISGYFEDHPPKPHDTAAGANTWHPVGESNLIGDSMDNCGYWGTGNLPSPYRPGSFTWPIPARWRIPGGPTNNFTWSDQVFSIDGSGTFSVSKFGQTVTRTINNVITPNL